jgi:hypothetical protein
MKNIWLRSQQTEQLNLEQVLATPGAFVAAQASGESPFDYVTGHLSENWGDADDEDTQENQLSPKHR